MAPEPQNTLLTSPEIKAQLRLIDHVVRAENDDDRRAAMANGLLAFVRALLVWLAGLLKDESEGAEIFERLSEDLGRVYSTSG